MLDLRQNKETKHLLCCCLLQINKHGSFHAAKQKKKVMHLDKPTTEYKV